MPLVVPVGVAGESGWLRGPLLWGTFVRIGRRISNENSATTVQPSLTALFGVCVRVIGTTTGTCVPIADPGGVICCGVAAFRVLGCLLGLVRGSDRVDRFWACSCRDAVAGVWFRMGFALVQRCGAVGLWSASAAFSAGRGLPACIAGG